MAVNPQLKDYIDQQTKAGVSKDIIKTALLGAGWQESDINEAMGISSPAAAAVRPVEIAKSAEVKPSEIKPIEIKSPEKESPAPFMTSDIFQPKGEPLFQPQAASGQKVSSPDNPRAASFISSPKDPSQSGGMKKFVLPALLGVAAIAFLGAAIFFYLNNVDLQAKLAAANQGSGASQTLIASLTNDKTSLTNQVASLNQTLDDLSNQLLMFAVPQGGSTSTKETAVSIKGALGGGGKTPYTVLTDKNIAVSIKNSKDPNVDAVLKPLLGNEVTLAGTHADADYGRSVITVSSVNGASVSQPATTTTTSTPAAAATSTGRGAGTSTVP